MMRLYRHEKVRYSRAMTISIGFRCDEGMILLSDRQISKEGGIKYYEKKLREISGEAGERGIFHVDSVYEGSPEAAKFVLDETEERISQLEIGKITLQALKTSLGDALKYAWKKHRSQMQVRLVTAISFSSGEFKLFRSKGEMLVSAEFECLGVGDSSVIRYLVETFQTTRMGMSHFLPLLIYTMLQAKKYIDGCGGLTDVVFVKQQELPTSGLRLVHTTLYGAVKDIEKEMLSIEGGLRHLFEVFYESRNDEAEFFRQTDFEKTRLARWRRELQSNRCLKPIILRPRS